MKTCDFKKDVLVAYCYGELTPEKMKEIEEHLSVCKHCLPKVEGLKRILALFKQQELKEIPSGLLDNYVHQVRERLNKEREVRPGLISVFSERISDFIENLRSILSPRLITALVTICIVVSVFAVMKYGRVEPLSLINQDIAFLEQLGEDVDEVFLKDDDKGLAKEIESSDTIILDQLLAQLDEETEFEEMFDDLEVLRELGEAEFDENDIDILEYLEILDEIEMESSTG